MHWSLERVSSGSGMQTVEFAEELLKCMQSGPELVTSLLKPFITVAELTTAGGDGARCWDSAHFGELACWIG